jgi:hypothetical protein
MNRLILGLYALPDLLTIVASLELMEPMMVFLCSGLACGATW